MPMPRCSGATRPVPSVSTRPPTTTRPALIGSRPAMMRSAVVLPEPEAPSRQPMVPAGTSKDRRSSTGAPP